jgi:hypothetical protein
VDAVNGLLSGAAFCVESEDALLDCLLKLGPAHFPLLRQKTVFWLSWIPSLTRLNLCGCHLQSA